MLRHSPIVTSLAVLLGAVWLTGCAPSLASQYADVARAVHERTGQTVEWNIQTPADIELNEAIQPLLAKPLSATDAVHIALVQNQSLQASLAGIGVSRADLMQAGLLSNPDLFGRYRWFTHSDKQMSDYELRLTQNFMDLVLIPLRRRVAKEELERVKSDVAADAFDLAGRVQIAYYTLQGRMQAFDEQSRLVQEFESTERESTAGARDRQRLELALAQARQTQADLEAQAAADREALNRLLGLSGLTAASWTLADELPQPSPEKAHLENIEALALQNRLDLTALRADTARIEKTIALQQVTRWVPFINAGIEYEKKSSSQRVIGPVLTIELPVFDWGQGRIARSRALLAQSRHQTAALETDIRSQVREAHDRLMAARAAVESYRDEILPESQKLTAFDQRGDGNWLGDRQAEAATRQKYIDALRDYWIAHVRLGQALGGG